MDKASYPIADNGVKLGTLSKDEIIRMLSQNIISTNAMIKKDGVWMDIKDTGWDLPTPQTAPQAPPMTIASPSRRPDEQLVTCPHCWHRFSIAEILYVSKHLELMGDPVLGLDAQKRFLPTQFNEQGYALDARGMVCNEMACPRCHLTLPDQVVDLPSKFFSIVGAPASGKSYYLAAMTRQLRTILSSNFDYSFTDTDATFNAVLNRYESLLFLNGNTEDYVALPKTDLQGSDFSHQIILNGMRIDLPLPFIFSLMPTPANPNYSENGGNTTNIIFYDNAGEHFEPGRDQITNLSSHHLMNSNGIMFLYDPLKDSRMIPLCDQNDPQISHLKSNSNQLVLLNEMIARIRRFQGLKSGEKCNQPIVVVIPKYDAWKNNFPVDLEDTDYLSYDQNAMQYYLDLGIILNVSYITRTKLMDISPEIVATCEAFFSTAYFIPVSALGRLPDYDQQHDMIGIKPTNLNPVWVEVPMLINFWHAELISAVESQAEQFMEVQNYKVANSSIVYTLPGMKGRETVPLQYSGHTVYDLHLGNYIKFPVIEEQQAQTSDEEQAVDDFWNN